MRGLSAGLLVATVWSSSTVAQERDRHFERINIALQQRAPIVGGIALQQPAPIVGSVVLPDTSTAPIKFGVFSFVQPTLPGEMVRVSLPIGELVSRAFKGVAAARHRRQEATARRQVGAALKAFAEERPRPRQ
jgi:hypothetical protein